MNSKTYIIIFAILFLLLLTAVILTSKNKNASLENLLEENNDAMNEGLTVNISDSVDVYIQDQHTEIIDLILHQQIDNFTLNSNHFIGEKEFNITMIAIAPVVGDLICLKEGLAFYQATVLNVTSIIGLQYIIEVDTPIDYYFTTSAFGCTSTTNMAIDGSVTPQIFKVSPRYLNEDVSWDITRIILVLSGEGVGPANDAPDDSDFGVTTNLDNGIVLRSVNGITKNIFNIKRNGEFRLRAYDVTYTEKTKAGLYSVGIRRSFAGTDKNGVTVRLDADNQDTIEIIIQDDLTEMFGFKAVAQGHVVDKS